ncbi:MAG: hypothetical protein ACD_79C00390G0003 [uncultured bacterium]|nr:MAG: hypothetical protein ACD_79C00390G0003 [uncultured bacterium]
MNKPLVEAINIKKYYCDKSLFKEKRIAAKALDDVSFDIHKDETLGLVGESGSGKTTLGKVILLLEKLSSGKILWNEEDITFHDENRLLNFRRQMQIIFQDPFTSLDPKMNVLNLISEGLLNFNTMPKKEIIQKVQEMLTIVGLNPGDIYKYPHEFSGGQRQRLAIARALILNPQFIVCDEIVSALDLSIRNKIINLLYDIKNKLKLSYLFISHDINLTNMVSDRIIILYAGKIVESFKKDGPIKDKVLHPYSKFLIEYVPDIKNKRNFTNITDFSDTPFEEITGCPFYPRCKYFMDKCKKEFPDKKNINNDHYVVCHLNV